MYYNRDLSWLGFNHRVLQEAASPNVPLFERFKFLAIFSSNLDEFFRVRYPYIMAVSHLKPKTIKKIKGPVEKDLAEKVQTTIENHLQEYGDILKNHLLPALEENNIVLYYNRQIEKEHRREIKELFLSTVLAFLQPIFFESTPNESFIPENNLLYFFVVLRKEGKKELMHSVLNIPANKVPRFFTLNPIGDKEYIIFLDDIIRENMECIFPGFEILGTYSIKFNRDAELKLEEEMEEDIIKKIEKQVKKREAGPPSRFLYEAAMPKNMQLFVANAFHIQYEEMFAGGRYHNLKDMMNLPISGKDFSYPRFKPLTSTVLDDCGNIFKVLEERDILLHLPYDSYNPILSFFNQAAIDPDVTEMYITLYRVATESHIVNALISAAKNGKKVTAFVELKARFDEENNIQWSKKMKEAGVRLVYSIAEVKVHSKTAIVIKKKKDVHQMYAVLSTGNFNESTARFYTDHALLTTAPAITEELFSLFEYLQTAKGEAVHNPAIMFHTLLVSRFNMIARFEQLINEQIELARNGKPAHIRIKLNNLEEPHMIEQLYKASNAGVKIDMLVRSVCSLMPGVDGISEHITVRRIVDRYLEHTRLFIFGTGADTTVWMGSADWMTRNLRRRIEVVTPVLDKHCRQELIDYFDLQWKDNDKAVVLAADGGQYKVEAGDGTEMTIHNGQQSIYQYLQNRG